MSAEIMDEQIESIKAIAAESRRELRKGTAAVCIDDRFSHEFKIAIPENLSEILITSEEDSGPQIPGGSAGILAVLAETAPENTQLNFKDLYSVTAQAHENVGYQMGVHMDNHHDETSDEQIFEMMNKVLESPDSQDLPGCGYAGMLVGDENKLKLSDRSQKFFKSIKLIPRMVAAGSKLVELEGHHADADKGEALAISNMKPGTTLDHGKLKAKGIKIYGHDPLVADELILAMAEVLEERGEIVWAQSLREDGSKIEREHHRIAAKALTGREPVEIH